ncbi:family 16 glycosylhydrolase [Actinomycetospora sp. CA-101289]|uniref:glycoside hydrolase family 16 protein n=1 Tax=Actinomycetospora sp. CA-101289 TaxID=3239893 RepID=UPI003D9684A8
MRRVRRRRPDDLPRPARPGRRHPVLVVLATLLALVLSAGAGSALVAPPASAAPAVVVDLLVTPTSAQAGQSVSASARVHGASGTVAVQAITIAVRNSSGAQFDFPGATAASIPTSGYTFNSGARTFAAGTYDAFVAVQINGTWTNLEPHKAFTVGSPSPGVVVDTLTVPTSPTSGQSVNASARLRATGASVAVQAVTVAVRGVGGTQADFPGATAATVPSGGYTFTSGARTFGAGSYEAFVAVQVNGTWYNLDPHKIFTVGAAPNLLTFGNEFNGHTGSDPNAGSTGTRGGAFSTDPCWRNPTGCNGNTTQVEYRADHVRQDGTNLVITADTNHGAGAQCGNAPCRYGSGRLTMLNWAAGGTPTFQQLGGHWEARMQLPKGSGMWPAFWTVGDPTRGEEWPQNGEIDIAEYFGGPDPSNINTYLHYGESADVNWGAHAPVDVSAWHTYALDWDNSATGYLKFSVDGTVIRTITAADANARQAGLWSRIQTHPQSIILDLAVGGAGGTPPTGAFSRNMLIDYVRVYETPMR